MVCKCTIEKNCPESQRLFEISMQQSKADKFASASFYLEQYQKHRELAVGKELDERFKQAEEKSELLKLIKLYGIKIEKKGLYYIGLCPFHDEETGSFTVDPAEGTFLCFGCGAEGGINEFRKKIKGGI